MEMIYPPNDVRDTTLVVTCSASVLSPQPHQLRFDIRGTKGSYTKYGLDNQHPHLVELGRTGRNGEINSGGVEGRDVLENYGVEADEDWGVLWEVAEGLEGKSEAVMGQDGIEFVQTKCVGRYRTSPIDR
jgi:predicted dehydrogenase